MINLDDMFDFKMFDCMTLVSPDLTRSMRAFNHIKRCSALRRLFDGTLKVHGTDDQIKEIHDIYLSDAKVLEECLDRNLTADQCEQWYFLLQKFYVLFRPTFIGDPRCFGGPSCCKGDNMDYCDLQTHQSRVKELENELKELNLPIKA